jgi:hypothetical protein
MDLIRTALANRHPGQHRQSGSALIVALVFLIVMTLLGLTTMSTSRLELKMAVNNQFANLAFQAAESGIDQVLRTPNLKGQLGTTDTFTLSNSYTYGAHSAATTTNYVMETLAPGYSIGTPALHYRISSTGSSAAGSGQAQNIQGFYIIGAKAN